MDCNARNSGIQPENDLEFDLGERSSGEFNSQPDVPIIGLPHFLALMANQLLSRAEDMEIKEAIMNLFWNPTAGCTDGIVKHPLQSTFGPWFAQCYGTPGSIEYDHQGAKKLKL